MTATVRVAVVQTAPLFGEPKRNVEEALTLMAEAPPADLYVLPELFNTGYNFNDRAELDPLAEPPGGQTMASLAAFCRKNNCHLVYGFAEKAAGGIYNSAALLSPGGLSGIYRKVHLFDRENELFAAGDRGFPVFPTPFGNIGIMICFDWIYPESARSLMLAGARIIAHPANLVLSYCPDALVTRSLENRVFIAMADRAGREDRPGRPLTFIGSSEIVSPRGEVLGRMGKDPGVIVREIDPAAADSKKMNEFNDIVKGRRPSEYRHL